jgi:restriction system protein
MPIPDFQTLMLPFLKMANDKREYSSNDFLEPLAEMYNVTEEEKAQMLASGSQRIFHNRVHWAKAYLKMAGLIENTRRGYFRITDRGLNTLAENPQIINIKYLKRFPDFQIAKETKKDTVTAPEFASEEIINTTPQEQIDQAIETINNSLGQDLLQKIKNCSWQFFEKLVIDLLLKMGYGGSKSEAAELIGKTGDEGIDGIIKEDRLGLDVIYIQAKKWDSTIGRPEIQKFVGALAGQGAKKGVFITTSKFSFDATAYLPKNETKVILIDGQRLVQLMIEFELGVSVKEVFKIKITDDDYFTED